MPEKSEKSERADKSAKANPLQSSARAWVPALTTKNLSIVVTGMVFIVAILCAKKEDIPKIAEILVSSHVFATTGWTLALVFLFGGAVAIRLIIGFYEKEMNRLAKERDELQKLLIEKGER